MVADKMVFVRRDLSLVSSVRDALLSLRNAEPRLRPERLLALTNLSCLAVSSWLDFDEFLGSYPRWLSIVRKLQNMNHIRALLFLYVLPRDIRKVAQRCSHSIMIVFPPHTLQYRIRFRQRRELEFRRLNETNSQDFEPLASISLGGLLCGSLTTGKSYRDIISAACFFFSGY